MSIADELQFVLDWEADRIGAVSAGTFKAQIAAVRDLEFQQAKKMAPLTVRAASDGWGAVDTDGNNVGGGCLRASDF
jgi:hypothetical protein